MINNKELSLIIINVCNPTDNIFVVINKVKKYCRFNNYPIPNNSIILENWNILKTMGVNNYYD
jgi:hypothetical protein